jgi:succinate dehydrogenase / fumarate reductase cytochrome b subunit
MSLTGFFLVIFLLVHLAINSLSLISSELFNAGSEFMATNPLIYIMQYVLALGFIIHIIMGIKLTRQNKAARPIDYTYNRPGENSSLSSRTMIYTGGLVLLFLILHMKDFFIEIKINHLSNVSGPNPTDFDLLVQVFSNPLYVTIYVVAFILLGFHLNHGFQSAFQSMGVNHKKYTPTLKKLGIAYSVLIAAGFSAIAIFHFIN